MLFWNSHKKDSSHFGDLKKESFDFSEIASYFEYKKDADNCSPLSDQTCSDLGLEELFTFVDRTISKVGQQYLYHIMRNLPKTKGEVEKHESFIKQLGTDKQLRDTLIQALSDLREQEAYSVSRLMTNEHPVGKPTIKALLTALKFLPAIFLILLIIMKAAVFGWLFITTLLANIYIHYSFKPKSLDYIYSVPQFIKLLNVAERLCKHSELVNLENDIPQALTALAPIKKAALFLRIENKLQGEMTAIVWLITELVHIFFLTEPVSFYNSVSILRNRNQEIEHLYRFIGLADSLLSVYFLRKSLSYYCMPDKATDDYRLIGEDIYHPLVPDCVSNSITVKDKSVLLSGSNMSGKTTFIRTIGINIVAAQTLHTVFARKFSLSFPLPICSSLMLADNMLEGKSFYMREVETIKEMITRSSQRGTNLFLFDEIFKGTNTTERIAAAKSVLSYLNTKGNLIIVSTHDTELATLLEKEYDLYHFSEVITHESFSFDYKLKPGPLYQRNAIRLLEINGFPKAIINEAYRTIEHLSDF